MRGLVSSVECPSRSGKLVDKLRRVVLYLPTGGDRVQLKIVDERRCCAVVELDSRGALALGERLIEYGRRAKGRM